MKQKISFELWKWSYFVILFLVGTGLIVLIGELLAGPLLRWLLHDIPYALPSWDRAKRWALIILFIGFFSGTVSWYAEKRSSGR
jgi:amino acid permease